MCTVIPFRAFIQISSNNVLFSTTHYHHFNKMTPAVAVSAAGALHCRSKTLMKAQLLLGFNVMKTPFFPKPTSIKSCILQHCKESSTFQSCKERKNALRNDSKIPPPPPNNPPPTKKTGSPAFEWNKFKVSSEYTPQYHVWIMQKRSQGIRGMRAVSSASMLASCSEQINTTVFFYSHDLLPGKMETYDESYAS